MNKKVLLITRTAIFIALLVAVQFVTKSLTQFVTGSLVNLILITAALTAGLASGLIVAGLSPFLAFLIGIGPAFIQIVPIVAIGNMVIVYIVWFSARNAVTFGKKEYIRGYLGVVIGAVAKFIVLFIGVTQIALPLLNLPAAKVNLISASFSWPQLVTALIGGIIAMSIVPVINRALKSKS